MNGSSLPGRMGNPIRIFTIFNSSKRNWMRFTSSTLIYALILLINGLSACHKKERSSESVELAMQKYDSFILNMNVDSISMLYTRDGELGKIAKGRDSTGWHIQHMETKPVK
jgi:hypothetical protein